jgi:hypothetical protein
MDKFKNSLINLLENYDYKGNRIYLRNSIILAKRKLNNDIDVQLRTVQKIAGGFDKIPVLFYNIITKELESFGFDEDLGGYVGRNFVRNRGSFDYTAKFVSKKSGVSTSQYLNYEYAIALPTIKRLEKISSVLGLIPNYFVEKCQIENI